MTLSLPLLLLAGILVSAWLGPPVLRAAVPVLVRAPRVAVTLLVASIASWLLAVLALGPVLAWVTTGPALLTGTSADFCRRCLDAANPLGSTLIVSTIPSVLLLGLPAIGTIALVLAAIRRGLRRRRTGRTLRGAVSATAETRVVAGHSVRVLPLPRPMAFTLPARHGGIVVTTGALEVLDDAEVAAVLAHEDGHLRQRHHAITSLVNCLPAVLQKVPLIATAVDAIPHYLEIAADDAARRRSSHTALASALLKLNDTAPPASEPPRQTILSPMLHATGPDRIRHLITPTGPTPAAARGAVALSVAHITLFITAGFAIHAPYASAAITGCA